MAKTSAKGYVALRNFDLNGTPKVAGVVFDLSDADAEPYLAVGVIEELSPEPVEETQPAMAEPPAAPAQVDHSSYE